MARDPGDLYEASSDAPELDDMVLLYYLDGFLDAAGQDGCSPRTCSARLITRKSPRSTSMP